MKKKSKSTLHQSATVQLSSQLKSKQHVKIKPRAFNNLNSARSCFKRRTQNDSLQFKLKKSPIQPLTFLDNNQDSFKLPTSNRKHSNNTYTSTNKTFFEFKDLPQQTYRNCINQSKITIKNSKNYLLNLQFKIKAKSNLEHNLQNTARQKFKDIILYQKNNKDNTQEIVNTKQAENLYQLLMTARKNNYLGYRKAKRQQLLKSTMDSKQQIASTARPNYTWQQQPEGQKFDIRSKILQNTQQATSQVQNSKLSSYLIQDTSHANIVNEQKRLQQLSENRQIFQPVPSKKVSNLVQEVGDIKVQFFKKQQYFKEQYVHQPELNFPKNKVSEYFFQKDHISDTFSNIPEIKTFNKQQQYNKTDSHNNLLALTKDVTKENKKAVIKQVKSELKPKQAKHKIKKDAYINKHPQTNTHFKKAFQQQQLEVIQFRQQNTHTKKDLQKITQILTKPSEEQKKATVINSFKKQSSEKLIADEKLQPAQAQQKCLNQQQQIESKIDLIHFYIERIEDIGAYRQDLKAFLFQPPIEHSLVQIQKICSYFMAHQALHLQLKNYELLNKSCDSLPFYEVSAESLQALRKKGKLESILASIEQDITSLKKVAKISKQQCKDLLKNEELVTQDGKTNFHLKCCSLLSQQFNKFIALYQQNPQNSIITKRCCYLIETYCTLNNLDGKKLKQYEQFDTITTPHDHIKKYQHFIARNLTAQQND